MLSKMAAFIREQQMIAPGEQIIAAVSGGADSVALLFALHLLRDTMPFSLSAAHFNHHLRGEESERDENFVKSLCDRYDIPLYLGGGMVIPGEKGLEAAAREARYAYFRTLPGKIATAHTADDNAETVIMHLIRGTGLKGLGAICPASDGLIRPMLTVTRREVEAFLAEYCLPHVEDSSNGGDDFLRNRIRHSVMPLLRQENPKIGENLSAMALRLRLDEDYLAKAASGTIPGVAALRQMHPAIRRRHLERFLKECGLRDLEQTHIARAEALVFAENPSARANLPGGLVIARRYDQLVQLMEAVPLETRELPCPGESVLPQLGLRVVCTPAEDICREENKFVFVPRGRVILRPRQTGDRLRLWAGSKSLKKWMIDRKIPAALRDCIPVLADDAGVIGVYGMGMDVSRFADSLPAVCVRFEALDASEDAQ